MRLAVLGPTVLEGTVGQVAISGVKARQLLTVLALSPSERLTLDRLIDVLWAEPPPSAAKTVQAHISRLRAALAQAGAPDSLTGGTGGYRLDLGDRLDGHVQAQLTRRAEAARTGGDVRLAAELLGQARELWRGEPDLPETPHGDVLRRSLAEQRLELAIAHLGLLIEAGAADQAVAELGQMVVAEPLNERLWELRILALYRSGRATEALRAYQHVCTVLADEVGVLPGPALRSLEAAILAHDDLALAGREPTRTAPTTRLDDIAYARAGETHIAHRTFGTGETPVLLLNPGLISIDTLLDEPHMASAIGRLADRRRVIAFDPRGIGLSDRTQPPETITIDDWVADAVAVLDANGVDSAHVFASGHGGLVAMTFAARHGDRVRSLTMVNAFARFTMADDYPFGMHAETFAAMQNSMQSPDPSPGVDALTLISPSVAADARYREWWDTAGRRAASPAAASALVTTMTRVDVRVELASITAPTLLIIRRGNATYDPGHGEFLAQHLTDVVVERQHDINEPWWIGDTNFIIAAFERFVRPGT
jgi:DNA-binding SARP family transcriptional activator